MTEEFFLVIFWLGISWLIGRAVVLRYRENRDRREEVKAVLLPPPRMNFCLQPSQTSTAGLCCVSEVEVSFAPSASPLFNPERPPDDILTILREEYDRPKPRPRPMNAHHRHICFVCHDTAIDCYIGNRMTGHLMVCGKCQFDLIQDGRLQDLTYQETVEAIFEYALSNPLRKKRKIAGHGIFQFVARETHVDFIDTQRCKICSEVYVAHSEWQYQRAECSDCFTGRDLVQFPPQ